MPGKPQELGSMNDALLSLGEKLKANARRPNIYGYSPHAKQLRFHTSPKRLRLLLGGNRSGKTTGGIIEDIWTALGEHPYRSTPEPPIRGRICSVDFVNGIEQIILPELSRWIPIGRLRGGSWYSAYDKQDRVLNFQNGSFIELKSYDQDLDKFAGTSRHFIHEDEEPPKDIHNENMARLIDTGGDSWITMTPLDGMTWIYDDIYEPAVSGDDPYVDIITVGMTENPHLNEGEVSRFLDGLDENERRARGKGEFVQLGGRIYPMFDQSIHVLDPFKPPMDWLWIFSLDHGFNNPTAWLFHAINPEGVAFTFKEWYQKGKTIDEHAAKVLEICSELGRGPDYFVGDPSIRNTDPITGTSIHQEYSKFGVPIMLGNNDVKAGLVKVARYLKPERARDNDGNPTGPLRAHLYVTSDCPNTIKEYSRYRWRTYVSKKIEASSNAQEVPHKKDDHAMDSTRYFIMSQPDLAAEQPMSTVRAQNLLGMPEAIPTTGFAVRVIPETTFSEASGEGSEWEIDEHMGGIY